MTQAQMQPHSVDRNTVRGEVSGWDRSGGYFVERTDVQIEGDRMVVWLPRAMSPHSVLFVRMLSSHGSLEHQSRLMQVTRSHKNRPSGYRVHCRTAQPRRKRAPRNKIRTL